MLIYIKTITDKTYTLEVESSDTIADVKNQLYKVSGIPPDQQRLIFVSRVLDDNKILADYNIQRREVLRLILTCGLDWLSKHNNGKRCWGGGEEEDGDNDWCHVSKNFEDADGGDWCWVNEKDENY